VGLVDSRTTPRTGCALLKRAPQCAEETVNILLKWFIWAVVGCAMASTAFAFKQGNKTFDTITRTVTGVVSDAGGKPALGAIVLLKDTKTLQIRSYVTKGDGVYRFLGLSSNDEYELRAQRNGVSSSAKTLSQFDNRKQAKIDLKLK
jgi:hypothetical protein